MIEIDLQLYAYTLGLLIIMVTAAVILIINRTTSDTLPVTTSKLFQAYFICGLFGWVGALSKDVARIPMDRPENGVFYVLCSYILIFAVFETARNRLAVITITIAHILLIAIYLNVPVPSDKTLLLSSYALIIYTVLSMHSISRAKQFNNAGHLIIAIALILVAFMSPIQIHAIIYLNDPALAYSMGLMAASTGFTLVGIGFLSSILISEQQQLKTISLHDPLTGLLNRRGLEFTINTVLGRAKRSKECISVIALDIDHFKRINDNYGHDAGDIALKTLAKALTEKVRSSDIWCRLGGEEFGLVLADCKLEAACKTAEIIRQRIEQISFMYEDHRIQFTASLGVSSACAISSIDELLKDADKALYSAKNQGRNRVCTSTVVNESCHMVSAS